MTITAVDDARSPFLYREGGVHQFKAGEDAEHNYKLQKFLSMLYDANDVEVSTKAECDYRLSEIYDEVRNFIQSKEVQAMLLTEQFLEADLEAIKSEADKKGRNDEKSKIAKNFIRIGISLDKIHLATGIDMGTLEKFKREVQSEYNP